MKKVLVIGLTVGALVLSGLAVAGRSAWSSLTAPAPISTSK